MLNKMENNYYGIYASRLICVFVLLCALVLYNFFSLWHLSWFGVWYLSVFHFIFVLFFFFSVVWMCIVWNRLINELFLFLWKNDGCFCSRCDQWHGKITWKITVIFLVSIISTTKQLKSIFLHEISFPVFDLMRR